MKRKVPLGYTLLLTLLVGLNLSLVCQGHEHGDHLTAPHLSFLGEPDEGGLQGNAPTPEASHELHTQDQAMALAGNTQQSCTLYALPSGLLVSSSWAKPSEPAESGPLVLGFVMLASPLDEIHVFRFEVYKSNGWRSQIGVTPEPPPPRSL